MANEQTEDHNDDQPDGREKPGDSTLVTEERRGTASTVSREEGRDNPSYRHRFSIGVCNHHCGRDHGRNVDDGAALFVGGRHIHRGVQRGTENHPCKYQKQGKSLVTDMAIKAVGNDGKTSGGDGDGRRSVDELGGLDGSTPVGVNVEPGTGEGGIVETTRVVTVNVGSPAWLEGDNTGESELVFGGFEGGEESGGVGDETVVGGRDELGSIVNDVGVYEGGDVGGRVGGDVGGSVGGDVGGRVGLDVGGRVGLDVGGRVGLDVGGRVGLDVGGRVGIDVGGKAGVEEGSDVEGVRGGVETVVLVGVDLGIIVSLVEE